MQGKLATPSNRSVSRYTSISQLVLALKQCRRVRDLKGGRKLHQEAIVSNFHTDKYVASVLIAMYSRCRDMKLARQVFEAMIDRDLVAWTTLILGYVENGEWMAALAAFTSMDCKPDAITYIAVIKACAGLATEKGAEKKFCLDKGAAIHRQALVRGLDSQGAREVFHGMNHRDVVSWTSLILGYVTNREYSVALNVFACMDCKPNTVTYVGVLKACGGLASANESEKERCLEKGIMFHNEIKDRGYESDVVVASTLIFMYARCGRLEYARQVLEKMEQKTVFSWTALITGYVENGESAAALDLFAVMDCEPDSFTYVAVLKACGLASEHGMGKHYCLEKGIWIHKQIRDKELDSDVVLANSLVFMYGKCGSIKQAREVFDQMQSRDAVTWNTIIHAYAENGLNAQAMKLFERMDLEPSFVTYIIALKVCGSLASENISEKQACLEKGVRIHEQLEARRLESELVVTTRLLDMYSKCGGMILARKVFEGLKNRSVITWTALILGYVENDESLVALELFRNMDCEPNSYTYMAVLKACGNLASVLVGQQVHARLCRLGLEQDEAVMVTLMDFYRKCVRMDRAQELFDCMHTPSVVAWTTLVTGYCSLGNAFQVFGLAKRMEETGLKMDGVAFTCILTACSQAGLVKEGKVYFELMLKSGVGLNMKHYSCVVDMLGRANRLEDALALIKRLPVEGSRDIAWTTLLGACNKWKDLEVGRVAFHALVEQ